MVEARQMTTELLDKLERAVGPEKPLTRSKQSFPPSYCVAWEDCQHDGVCHDPADCGAEGPSTPEPYLTAALRARSQGGE